MHVADRTCDGCDRSHVDVWWTVTDAGMFRCYCRDCWGHFVGVWVP
jgi:hypothetical protein